jgi:hypothetical protein
MSSSQKKISLLPNAYTISLYNGIKCICMASKNDTLTYVKYKLDFFSSFDHVPYTPIEIEGSLLITNIKVPSGNKVINFFNSIKNWKNIDPHYTNKDITVGFFDIEVEGSSNIFPQYEKDEIKCISFKVIGTPTQVFTTFSMVQLQRHYIRKGSKEILKDYIEFPNSR